MPASFKTATLFPDCAMRVRRVALPLRVVPKEEKVSLCSSCQYTKIKYAYMRYALIVMLRDVRCCQ